MMIDAVTHPEIREGFYPVFRDRDNGSLWVGSPSHSRENMMRVSSTVRYSQLIYAIRVKVKK